MGTCVCGPHYLELCRFGLFRSHLTKNVVDPPCFHHKCTKHKCETNRGSPDVNLIREVDEIHKCTHTNEAVCVNE